MQLQFHFYRFGPYFVEPIICGLHPKTNEPYIASCDLIGCPMEPEDFVVGGTCTEQLYGISFCFSSSFLLHILYQRWNQNIYLP